LGDVDRFSRDLVASKFEDAAAIIPRSTVIPDLVLRYPQASLASNSHDLELERRRINSSPCEEVGFAFESLTGLWKLQHGIVMVELMTLVYVRRFVFPVAA